MAVRTAVQGGGCPGPHAGHRSVACGGRRGRSSRAQGRHDPGRGPVSAPTRPRLRERAPSRWLPAGRALAGAGGVAVAGSYVYIASVDSGAVAIFHRNGSTGTLHQLPGRAGCVSETAKEGCAKGRGLVGAFSLAISPNGRNLYVASLNGVAEFVRHPKTGQLTQLSGANGCIAEFIGDGCGPGRALQDVASVAVSPDGRNVYAASFGSNAVVALSRDPSTGALSQAPGLSGCTNEDGGEGCQQGKALKQAFSVVVSPNGKFVYVGSILSSAIMSFERESDGSLRQIPSPGECTSEGGREGCATGRGLNEVAGVAISPGGGYLYSGASRSSAVAALFLTPTSGGLDQLKGPYACAAERASRAARPRADSPGPGRWRSARTVGTCMSPASTRWRRSDASSRQEGSTSFPGRTAASSRAQARTAAPPGVGWPVSHRWPSHRTESSSTWPRCPHNATVPWPSSPARRDRSGSACGSPGLLSAARQPRSGSRFWGAARCRSNRFAWPSMGGWSNVRVRASSRIESM